MHLCTWILSLLQMEKSLENTFHMHAKKNYRQYQQTIHIVLSQKIIR